MAIDTSPEGEFACMVYEWLSAVPAGRVTSYGRLARLAQHPRHARFVGRLMSQLPKDTKLPWWRVLRSDGRLACQRLALQQTRLQEEGVVILGDRVPKRFFWEP